jgi:replication factor C subunit 3/5
MTELDKTFELWINDKCPTDLDDVIGNSFFIKTIKNYIRHNRMPNLLLYGPEGTGKKMIAKLIAKKYNGDYKIISATINKSKDVVVVNMKSKDTFDCINITAFAQARNKIEFGDKMKIIIITNFDEMTLEAQNALRSIIETYAHSVRFIITTTNIENVIAPLQSRFNTFIIKRLSDKNINRIIKNLVDLPQVLIDTICTLSDGDIRQIFNYIQLLSGCTKESATSMFNSIFKLPEMSLLETLLDSIYIDKNAHKCMEIASMLRLKDYNAQLTLTLFNKMLVLRNVSITDIYYSSKLILKCMDPRVHFITLINKLIINNI